MGRGLGSSMPKRYHPGVSEPRQQAFWMDNAIYQFNPSKEEPIYSIDTPPPTVSGHLHLGHVYSYSHPDFIARFWRMNGYSVLYPMGFDDNGLPTERLVESRTGTRASDIGREAFIEKCLQVCEDEEVEYERLWRRLGLSIDWRYVYRTIDERSRRISQWSFLDLHRKGLVYRREAPTLWCPECQTAIAQAELKDLERESVFYTLGFQLTDGQSLPIATTRPELLPACVAVLVHPEDERSDHLEGCSVREPLFNREVPLLVDETVDPELGTGVAMCCTFGDNEDIAWWQRHHLPLRIVLGSDGRFGEHAGPYAGLNVDQARQQIIEDLEERKLVLDRQTHLQSIRVHERCDTPVEIIVTKQWFVRVLDFKDRFLDAGDHLRWYPNHMKNRYLEWVENLHWDWCISRQRFYGVPFPVWYCKDCGEVALADEKDLPVDPLECEPLEPCVCGGAGFTPEKDVMDTWATSSLSPQIVERLVSERVPGVKVFPMSLRPQGHEIIRTWTFYTVVKSAFHTRATPWEIVAISGWGLAPAGTGKISKSRGGGPIDPMQMIERYSADAVRYWAASTGFGRDSIIDEEKIRAGRRLSTKLWNVARFCEPFISNYQPPNVLPASLLTDHWVLSRLVRMIETTTNAWREYDYVSAKVETESFFWNDLADNYLEMVKLRLYDHRHEMRDGARFALYHALLTTLKLFAPILPFITEEIYQVLFAVSDGQVSIHRSSWPVADPDWVNSEVERFGEAMLEIIKAVRRYKSERHLSLATEIETLCVAAEDPELAKQLRKAETDLKSAVRAHTVEVVDRLEPGVEVLESSGQVKVVIKGTETTWNG